MIAIGSASFDMDGSSVGLRTTALGGGRLAARQGGELTGEPAEPALHLGEGWSGEPVVDVLAALLGQHEPGLDQDFQVMADGWLAQSERTLEVAGADPILDRAARGIGPVQELDDLRARRVGQGFEAIDVHRGPPMLCWDSYIDRFRCV